MLSVSHAEKGTFMSTSASPLCDILIQLELESDPTKGRTDETEAVSEEQIIGILKEAASAGASTKKCPGRIQFRSVSNPSQSDDGVVGRLPYEAERKGALIQIS
jgi:hypothetical protein